MSPDLFEVPSQRSGSACSYDESRPAPTATPKVQRSQSLSREAALEAAAPLITAGIAVHWLKPRSKAPIENHWSIARPHTIETFSSLGAYRTGANIGVRLGDPSKTPAGYLRVIDLDIRKPETAAEAHAQLRALLPGYKDLPTVASGSGGESRHFYFVSDRSGGSRKLARSKGFSYVHDKRLGRDVKKYDWEIELFGTGKQVVLPPSIHPDTELPYLWLTPLNADMFDLGCAPFVSSTIIAGWGGDALAGVAPPAGVEDEDDDDLEALVRQSPLGLEEHEIDALLNDLPEDWVEDRDTWLAVGMAIHHEYRGSHRGFEKWCAWSKRSIKFDAKDSATAWKSFKGGRKHPKTMRTLIKAVQQEHGRRSTDQLVADDGAEDWERDDRLPLLCEPKGKIVHLPEPWVRDKRGDKVWCAANAQRALSHDPQWQGVLAFDEFNHVVMLTARIPGTSGRFTARELTDNDVTAATAWFNRNGFPTATEGVTRAAFHLVARDNVISPVRHYLEGLAWDGKRRIDTWLTRYLGVKDSPYVRAVGRAWLISAVARAIEPGCKADHMLVLEGPQGIGKSTCVRLLCGDAWFSDSLPDMHSKDASIGLRGKWIIEVAELSAMRRSGVEAIKAFVSRQQERFRPPYGRGEVSEPRRCVFIGTMNPDGNGYLKDDTGGRRFWPVATTWADAKAIARDRDQIWAEAIAEFNGGSPWWPDDETAALAAVEQAERLESDPWTGEVLTAAERLADDKGGAVSTRAILSEMRFEGREMGKGDQMRVAGILTRGGWRKDGKFKERGPDRDLARYVRE